MAEIGMKCPRQALGPRLHAGGLATTTKPPLGDRITAGHHSRFQSELPNGLVSRLPFARYLIGRVFLWGAHAGDRGSEGPRGLRRPIGLRSSVSGRVLLHSGDLVAGVADPSATSIWALAAMGHRLSCRPV
jgi:hypothetical protein